MPGLRLDQGVKRLLAHGHLLTCPTSCTCPTTQQLLFFLGCSFPSHSHTTHRDTQHQLKNNTMSTVNSLPSHVSISKIDGDIQSLTEAAAIKEAVEEHIKTNVVDAGQPAPESVRAVYVVDLVCLSPLPPPACSLLRPLSQIADPPVRH